MKKVVFAAVLLFVSIFSLANLGYAKNEITVKMPSAKQSISKIEAATILGRHDILIAEEVWQIGNVIAIVWIICTEEGEYEYIETVSIGKMQRYRNHIKDYRGDNDQECVYDIYTNKYLYKHDNSKECIYDIYSNQYVPKEHYYEKLYKDIEQIQTPDEAQNMVERLMNEDWQSSEWPETLVNKLASHISYMPNTFDVHLDLISQTTQKPAKWVISNMISYFDDYLFLREFDEKYDEEKMAHVIEFLQSLLNNEVMWASIEAKSNSQARIGALIYSLNWSLNLQP